MEFIIYDGDGATLRDFPPESLTPPVDILGASAAARKGERLINPLTVLVRHVLAVERPRSNVCRFKPHGLKLPAISPEIHAEYQTAFAARVSHYKQAGKTEAEAREAALSDFGCVEFYDFMRGQGASPLASSEAIRPAPHPYSEVERTRIRAANTAKVTRLRKQWATARRGKGEAA